MTALDDLPDVDSFFGIDLKTGSLMIAAIGIVHPMAYGCSFFIPMSYLLVTIWILVALFFAASVLLVCGLVKGDALLCTIWVWYAVIFVVIMLMMMILLALVFTSRRQRNRVFVVILGMLWYICPKIFIRSSPYFYGTKRQAPAFNQRKNGRNRFEIGSHSTEKRVTIYFILVVNSHRKRLQGKVINDKMLDKNP